MDILVEWSQHNPELVEDITAHIMRLIWERDNTEDGDKLLPLCQDIRKLFIKLGEASTLIVASRSEMELIGQDAYRLVSERLNSTVH